MNYPDADDLVDGKFTDGDPVTETSASVLSASHMNSIYDELIAVIEAGGIEASNLIHNQISLSIQQQIKEQSLSLIGSGFNSAKQFVASGDENNIVLSSSDTDDLTTSLNDHDKVAFIVLADNSSTVTVDVDALGAVGVANVDQASQLLKGALVTLSYLDGQFYVTQQINPRTGNDVDDIGKIIFDSVGNHNSVKEVILNGDSLSRETYSIFWGKVQSASNLVEQATKDADPETYAGYYGTGDGETTFTLPDLSGEFIRALDDEREVGSNQLDALQDHDHYLIGQDGQEHVVAFQDTNYSNSYVGDGGNVRGDAHIYVGYVKNGRIADETRPRNIAYYAKTRI